MTRPATVHDLDEGAKALAAKAFLEEAKAVVFAHTDHPTLTEALLAAINDLGVIGKTRTADAGSYSYDYADLAAVVSEAKSVLRLHGLAVRTPVHAHPEGLAVTVQFLHASGVLNDEPLPFPRGRDAQATGSAITYFRRYALLASLNLATGDDDDGAKAIPAAPSFVWTRGAVKARLLELLKDEAAAKEAWVNGHGDELTEWSAEAADLLAALWHANQPVEEPSLPLDGET